MHLKQCVHLYSKPPLSWIAVPPLIPIYYKTQMMILFIGVKLLESIMQYFIFVQKSAIWFTSAVRRQWEAIKVVINAGMLEGQRCVIVVEREMIT